MIDRIAGGQRSPIKEDTVVELRVLLAGLALLAWFRATGADLGLRANRRFFVIVGTVNSGVPFALFAYAALHIPAAYSAVRNRMYNYSGAVTGLRDKSKERR